MYFSRVRMRPDIKRTQLANVLSGVAGDNGYNLHQMFWGLFKEDPNKKRDFMFREELANEQLVSIGKRKADPIYYLMSAEEPLQNNPIFEVMTKPYEPQLSVGDKLSFKLRANAVVTRDKKRHDLAMDTQQQWLLSALNTLNLAVPSSKAQRKKQLLDYATDIQTKAWQSIIEDGPFWQKLEQQTSLSRSQLLDWTLKTLVENAIVRWWQKQGENKGFEVLEDKLCGSVCLQATTYQKHYLPKKNRQAGFNSWDLSGEIVVRDIEKFNKTLFEGIGRAKAFGCGLMMIRRV